MYYWSQGSTELAWASTLLVACSYGLGAVMSPRLYKVSPGIIEHKYCPNCRTALEQRQFDGVFKSACPACDYVHWNNPVTVGCMVVPSGEDGIVLVKRKYNPQAGMWALPGGFGDPNECPHDTAVRETLEELTLRVEIERLLGVMGTPDCNQTLVFYLAKRNDGTPIPGSDAEEARVFKIDELPEMAFPAHQEIIDNWIAGRSKTKTMV